MGNGRSSLGRKGKGRKDVERRELEESLSQTRLLLAQAYSGFNTSVDQELVESYIYEIQALQARYSYLLRLRKALTVRPEPAATSDPALPVA